MVLSTAYLPPIEWYYHLATKENSKIEGYENFEKQSYRNRTTITTPNGVLALVIPIQSTANKAIQATKISYAQKWQHQHWKAIQTSYKNSPFFEYYEQELGVFYQQEYVYLWEYNMALIEWINKQIRFSTSIISTLEYENSPTLIHPKIATNFAIAPYYQVFQDKIGFQSQVSILDLLCSRGNHTMAYLKGL